MSMEEKKNKTPNKNDASKMKEIKEEKVKVSKRNGVR